LQEMVQLNARQILVGKDKSYEQAWELILSSALGRAAEEVRSMKVRDNLQEIQQPYKMMDSKSMVGCFIIVFVKS